jgi:hypothetical protein
LQLFAGAVHLCVDGAAAGLGSGERQTDRVEVADEGQRDATRLGDIDGFEAFTDRDILRAIGRTAFHTQRASGRLGIESDVDDVLRKGRMVVQFDRNRSDTIPSSGDLGSDYAASFGLVDLHAIT